MVLCCSLRWGCLKGYFKDCVAYSMQAVLVYSVCNTKQCQRKGIGTYNIGTSRDSNKKLFQNNLSSPVVLTNEISAGSSVRYRDLLCASH